MMSVNKNLLGRNRPSGITGGAGLSQETEEARRTQANSFLSVCLPDPKDPLGSPSADSEYIVATDAHLNSPASLSPLVGSKGEQEPC